jgi:hypothetical protein
MPSEVNNPCNKYIGLSEEDAQQQIKADGLCSRIMGRDGESYFGTCDFRLDRVNLIISDGRIITADLG